MFRHELVDGALAVFVDDIDVAFGIGLDPFVCQRTQHRTHGHAFGGHGLTFVQLEFIHQTSLGFWCIGVGPCSGAGLFSKQNGLPRGPDDAVERFPIGTADHFPGDAGLQVDHRHSTATAAIVAQRVAVIADSTAAYFMGAV